MSGVKAGQELFDGSDGGYNPSGVEQDELPLETEVVTEVGQFLDQVRPLRASSDVVGALDVVRVNMLLQDAVSRVSRSRQTRQG